MYLLEGHITTVDSKARANRVANDEYLQSLFPCDENLWIHSRLIADDMVKASGSFTTLPVRINKHDDAANAATDRVTEEWALYIRDGQEKLTLNARSDLGNLYSFGFPEADPARLDVVTYWGSLGLLHDDHSEAAKEKQAWAEHKALSAGIDITNAASGDEVDLNRTLGLKRMAAESILAGMSIDYERCLYMVDMYRTAWVDVVEDPRPKAGFQSMTEYMDYRNHNVGMSAFWPMVSFAMGYSPNDAENEMIKHVLEPTEEGICLTNDYWSWEREYDDHLTNGDRITNAVDVAMRTLNLNELQAKEWLKNRLIDLECEYVQRKVAFYKEHPDVSIELQRWIEQAGAIMSGSHYWASSAPRHHAYKEHRRNVKMSGHTTISCSRSDDSMSEKSSSRNDSVLANSPPTTAYDFSEVKAMLSENQSLHSGLEPDADDKAADESVAKEGEAVLLAPVEYICSMPSKGIRAMFSEAFNLWLKVPDSSLKTVDKIIGDLHNASLILDDIEDESMLRRGQIATHLIFGTASSINSANFMFVRAVQDGLNGLQSKEAVPILLDALQCMYRGQALDLHWKYHMEPPTEEQYLHMIDSKTGGLFRMLLRLAMAEAPTEKFGPGNNSMDRLVILFGRFFQIRDDYMNLCSDDYTQQKGSCEDLDEGKFSHPLIQLFKLRPAVKMEILGIFRSRDLSNNGGKLLDHAKQRILSHLKDSGALDASRRYLEELANSIEDEITKVERIAGDRNPLLRVLLCRLRIR